MNRNEHEFKILSPTAILGYGFPEESFDEGIRQGIDLIAVDAGSVDPGPYYLGSGKSFTDGMGVKRDLKLMLIEACRLQIPLIVGTAGGSGAHPHVLWCKKIIEEIARENNLAFKMGTIFADIEKEVIFEAVTKNQTQPLDGLPELDKKTVEQSVNIVAQMGMEPIQKALEAGCQVVLAGRAYDPAVFSALPVMKGFDPGLAIHLGKILECAAIAATPGSGADCVLGILKKDSFILKPLNSQRKFTTESVAAHSLYEKSDPYHLPGPDGILDLTDVSFTQISESEVEVSGSKLKTSDFPCIKLEGVIKKGYRTISICGIKDPIMIKNIDSILKATQNQVESRMKNEGLCGEVFFHIYGYNGVMQDWENMKKLPTPNELCIIIEAIGETQFQANTTCSLTRSTLLHYGYPGRIATAGNLAFPFSPSDISGGEIYEFSIYHLMKKTEQTLFQLQTEMIQ